MYFKYKSNSIDNIVYNFYVILNQPKSLSEEDANYSFSYWTNELTTLMSHNLVDAPEHKEKVLQLLHAGEAFAAVYATADSWSYGEKKFELDDKNEPEEEYFEDHSVFKTRAEAFRKANAYSIVQRNSPPISGKLYDYLERGCRSAAPKTEDEFVKWAGAGPMMEERGDSWRKVFRVTSDLREAYKQLIKACMPFIDSPANKAKAKQLYKDFYHFTALEWNITPLE